MTARRSAGAAFQHRPCAASPFKSYRCASRYGGWIMIGARDDADALREARRSDPSATVDRLQRWDGAAYAPVRP